MKRKDPVVKKPPRPPAQNPVAWLRTLLSRPGGAPVPHGSTTVDWLVAQYRTPQSKCRTILIDALISILGDASIRQAETGAVCASALELIRRAGVSETIPLLRQIVDQRLFAKNRDDYSDLHGRALAALYALNGVDLKRTWSVEVEHRDYAPLVFALIRETEPGLLPSLIPTVTRLGFLPEALRSIIVERPDDYLSLLKYSAKEIANDNHPVVRQEFLRTLPHLDLPSYEEHVIRSLFDHEPDQCPTVLLLLDEQLATTLTVSLRDADLTDIVRLPFHDPLPYLKLPAPYLVVLAAETIHPNLASIEHHVKQGAWIVAVFHADDPTTLTLYPSWPHSVVTLPVTPPYTEVLDEVTNVIRDRVLEIASASEHATEQSPRPPTPTATTASGGVESATAALRLFSSSGPA